MIIPAEPLVIDWAALEAEWAAQRRAAEGARAFERAELLKSLRSAGITELSAHYDGYGDSGNIEELDYTPTEIAPSQQTARRVEDLLWGTITQFHAGFENNAGGFGEIHWSIEEDRMSLEHNERIESTETYSYGDI